jgi:6-phosphofructokinase 1
MNAGPPAPGMNTAGRAAVRIGLDRGHIMLGVRNSFQGLANGEVFEMDWMSVNGWAPLGGSELGTNRKVPSGGDLYAIARAIEQYQIQGLLVIGGWSGYQSVYKLHQEREDYPAFNIPIVCLPATINNNLPGTDLSVGADTALNNIIDAVDKVKQSAVAQHRCFIVEVMGRKCGYLALMSGLASGAERVYMNEDNITLRDIQADIEKMNTGFQQGKRLGLIIRSETAHPVYTTAVMASLFDEEGGDLFDVRTIILGHLQQGGNPSPFDRIQATRLATRCINYLIEQADQEQTGYAAAGLVGKEIKYLDMDNFSRMVDLIAERPKTQWWMDIRPISRLLAQPGPSGMPPGENGPG